MKKLIINLFIFVVLIFVTIIIILSTSGIETNKFNKLISEKVSQTKQINLELNSIKFKINPKKLSLYLETQNPKIIYREVLMPVQTAKVYIDFLTILKSNTRIEKINLILKEIGIVELNKLAATIKPSTFKSLLINKIKEGKLLSKIEIFFTDKGELENFIAKGTVRNFELETFNGLNFKETDFEFFADKKDVLIKNIFGKLEDIKISDGDIKINLDNGIKLSSNFNSKFNFDKKHLLKYSDFLKKFNFLSNLNNLKANFNNDLLINLDKTYKIKKYRYEISGKLDKGTLELSNPIKNQFITDTIKTIYFSDLKFKTNFSSNKINSNGEGKYSFNGIDYLKINFKNYFKNELMQLRVDFDFINNLELDIINYSKSKDSTANVLIDLEKNKDNILINNFAIKEKKNLIKVNHLLLKKNKFFSFKKIEVVTQNNNFHIYNDKKILIKGRKFDGSNLAKYFQNRSNENQIQNLSSKIEINFDDIKVPMSENLQNFKLIGEIKKGKFVKISSKGDYGGDNFLDISMKKDKNSDQKYLEIYSDLTRPLLTEYNFFRGLAGGKLLFTSIIDKSKSQSKLKIENFKVVNAPGVIKLLSLADLGGLADLAEGEGLSFDVLEIEMEKNNNFLKINEILALGPSISVLMEGYQDENGLTSLRGTLVPAKTLNKMISKIPVLGDIVVPKEIGEGLFGISFKMKGHKDKIKTTINPIRTLTPRFIQKIIDRKNSTK